jgi:hypothetical protein
MIKYLAKNALFWVGLVFSAAGLFLTAVSLTEVYQEVQFANDGRIVFGTVEAKRIDVALGDKGRTIYLHIVSYEFDPQTIPPQRGENEVYEEDYHTISIGDQIKVEYLVGNPETHRLAGTASGWGFSKIVGILAAVLVPIGLISLIVASRRALRQTRLWNKGIAHIARVVEFSCHDRTVKEAERHYLMIYEYEVPGGEMKKGKSKYHTWSWFGRIAEGDTIDIVIDPNNPDTSEWRREME